MVTGSHIKILSDTLVSPLLSGRGILFRLTTYKSPQALSHGVIRSFSHIPIYPECVYKIHF